MALMKKEDVEKLAVLARVELSPEELAKIPAQIDEILSYVHKIDSVTADEQNARIESAAVRNVTRPDNFDTAFGNVAALIAAAPEAADNYIKVKKIL